MRCPQCGTAIVVDFPSVKMTGEDFMLLQLKCQSCAAFIVLHVNLTEQNKHEVVPVDMRSALLNASSTLSLSEDEMKTLRTALTTYDGSFEKMFGTILP